MPSVSQTGQDTITIDGLIFATLADMKPFDVTFPDPLGTVKVGKNGNTIYAKNEMGRRCDVTLRVLLGGADDQYMNGRMQQWITDPSIFTLLTGVFVKRVGDGQGNITTKVYNCMGGFFQKQVEAMTSAEGDAEQSVAVYPLAFGNCQVNIE